MREYKLVKLDSRAYLRLREEAAEDAEWWVFRKEHKRRGTMIIKKSSTYGRDFLDDVEGFAVTIEPIEGDDLWHIFNLIQVGDVVEALTQRRVTQETGTGSTRSEKKTLRLCVRVAKPPIYDGREEVQVSGRVIKENEAVGLGQYHTLDLVPHQRFTLWKRHGWDSVALATLEEAMNPDQSQSVAAVNMREGHANICLITPYRTILRGSVTHKIPGKMSSSKDHDKERQKFYRKTAAMLTQLVDFSKPRPLLVASPGFAAGNFKKFMSAEGTSTSDKTLTRMGKDAVVVHSSSEHLHALNEVINSPEAKGALGDMRFGKETAAMDEFYRRMRHDDGRAWYGAAVVEKAVAEGAVGRGGGVLMISNDLFRSEDVAARKKWVGIVDKVREAGGEVRIMSSEHESGKRLELLGSIAVITTYPMPDLDEDDEDEGDGEDGNGGEGDGEPII